MTDGREVARHYGRASLADAISGALRAAGLGGDGPLTPDDLAPLDEFHMGGREATLGLAERLDLPPGATVLDIGCGLGGPARLLASRRGCLVVGVDLTPEYVEIGRELTRRAGLDGRVDLRVGSGLALPFGPESFDAATLLHVGMNVPDKPALFREAARVLRPGGVLAVYDVMRVGPGPVAYPTPWASTEDASFLEESGAYRRALAAAGFAIEAERDRRDLAIETFRRMRARAAEAGGPPPLGLHVLMGPDAPAKVANLLAALEPGIIAPVEMICRRA